MFGIGRKSQALRKSLKLQREAVDSCLGTLADFRDRLALQNARLGPPDWLPSCEYQIDLVGKTLNLQLERAAMARQPLDGFGEQLGKSLNVIDYWDAKIADRVVADATREAMQNSSKFGEK